MKTIFKPKITKKLINTLENDTSVQAALKQTKLSINKILKNYTLEIPNEFQPNVGWLVFGPKTGIDIYLIEKILKTAWSYTIQGFESKFHSNVCCELSGFKTDMDNLSKRLQNRKNSKLLRPRIPAADKFIGEFLEKKADAHPEEIWESLPEERDDQDLCRIDDVLYCDSTPDKSLSLRAFKLRVQKIKNRRNT